MRLEVGTCNFDPAFGTQANDLYLSVDAFLNARNNWFANVKFLNLLLAPKLMVCMSVVAYSQCCDMIALHV